MSRAKERGIVSNSNIFQTVMEVFYLSWVIYGPMGPMAKERG